jgi:peptidoglycan biosynthesis protein MviN/MurJ (putative lipid II flippase)
VLEQLKIMAEQQHKYTPVNTMEGVLAGETFQTMVQGSVNFIIKLEMLFVRTTQCTFLPTLFSTITLLFHSHLNSYHHFTLSFQRYTTSLLFTICLICFAYNFTLLSYLTIDQKCISAETVRTAD